MRSHGLEMFPVCDHTSTVTLEPRLWKKDLHLAAAGGPCSQRYVRELIVIVFISFNRPGQSRFSISRVVLGRILHTYDHEASK